MKLVKSLLLGSAAGLCAAAGVQAADLPSKKAAAVEYVRVCSTSAQASSTSPAPKPASASAAVFAPIISMRSRSPAQPTRSASALAAASSSTPARRRLMACCAPSCASRSPATRARVHRYGPHHDEPRRRPGLHPVRRPDRRSRHLVLRQQRPAHRALGHLALLGRARRRPVRLHLLVRQRLLGHAVARRWPSSAARTASSTAKRRDPRSMPVSALPDVVGASEIYRHLGHRPALRLRCTRSAATTCFADPAPRHRRTFPDTDYGFAVQGSVGVNLPMLGEGDAAWIDAAYADGALSYISGVRPTAHARRARRVFWSMASSIRLTATSRPVAAGRSPVVCATTGPRPIRQSVFGSYARFEYSASRHRSSASSTSTKLRLGSNVIWSPVSRSRYRCRSHLRPRRPARPGHARERPDLRLGQIPGKAACAFSATSNG